MAVVEHTGGAVQLRGVRDGTVVCALRMLCGCGGAVQLRGVRDGSVVSSASTVERCQSWQCGVQCLKDVVWLWWCCTVERCQRWQCGVQCLKDATWLWWSIVVVLYS